MGSTEGCSLPIQRSTRLNSCVYSSLTRTLGNEVNDICMDKAFSPIIALTTLEWFNMILLVDNKCNKQMKLRVYNKATNPIIH